jgi:signal transduction histidine kinase
MAPADPVTAAPAGNQAGAAAQRSLPASIVPPEPQALRFEHAQFVASPDSTPPLQGWTTVSLPDSWRLSHPQLSGFAWYRMTFSFAGTVTRPLAIYVPHLSLAGEFWLNGSLLNPDVRYDVPGGPMGTTMSDQPWMLTVPAGLFHTGVNTLDIRLRGDTLIRSGLSAITLAPEAQVRSAWQWRYAMQVVVPQLLIVVAVCCLCFLVVYVWRQRRLHVMQLGLLIGVVAVVSYFSAGFPGTRADQQALRLVVTTLMYWVLCLVGYRMSGVRARWYPPLVHGVSVLTLLVTFQFLLAGNMSDRIWQIAWPHTALRAIVIAMLVHRAWRERSWKYGCLAVSAIVWLVTMIQSVVILLDRLPWDDFRLSEVGALPFCAVVLFFFAERFILDREETVLQLREAIAGERSRILQDMHDGMGAHLITALRLARREDVDREDLARSIEESLQDLRLIIDSLDLAEHDLLPLLGNLRFRLEPRLKALGVRLEWDVQPPLPELSYLTPESALAILRIVQEAINNAIQHGQPRSVRITARAEHAWILVQVSDDGRGFDLQAVSPRSMRGLTGMRLRADKLGAVLNVSSEAAGTRISLRLPYRSAITKKGR